MADTGTAEGKVAYVADAFVTVTDEGEPIPKNVYVKANGTVQFANSGDKNWRVRLWTREHEHHADVDLFLPARSGLTVIVDPQAPADGFCEYEILEGRFASNATKALHVEEKVGGDAIPPSGASGGASGGGSNATANTSRSGGGGGTIRIGPTP
jgi:hypothetical protein